MARKGKVGIDYFSHDVDMLNDHKIKIIKAKYGLMGYAVYIRLLEELYRDKGYYLKVNEDFNILFSDENNLDYDVYISILNDCINKGLFNKEIYEKYSILTSKRIQENYLAACERRKSIQLYNEYLVLNLDDVNIKTDNVNILTLNDDIGTQSKEKEKKKEKKEKDLAIEKDFEEIWRLYPNKKGKIKSFGYYKKIIKKYSKDQVIDAVKRYSKEVKNKDKEYIKHGSTFFNEGIYDYIEDEKKQDIIIEYAKKEEAIDDDWSIFQTEETRVSR